MRSVYPLILLACGAVAFGCSTSTEIVLGDGMPNGPVATESPLLPLGHPPLGKGGGPPSICHPDPGDLGEPSDVPEGFEEPDHSDISPAHPPHLRKPEIKHWEDRI